MRVLPGSIDIGVPQGDGGDPMFAGIELQVLFTHPLGDAIRADRIGRSGLGRWCRYVAIEHPTGGGKDNSPAAGGHCGIKNIDQTDAVHLRVKERLPHGPADRHLGCLMTDGIGSFVGEYLRHRGGIADVDLMQRHARRQVFSRAAGKVIEHGNCMAGCQQGVNDMAADKAGTAGDECLHVFFFGVGEEVLIGGRRVAAGGTYKCL